MGYSWSAEKKTTSYYDSLDIFWRAFFEFKPSESTGKSFKYFNEIINGGVLPFIGILTNEGMPPGRISIQFPKFTFWFTLRSR